MGKSGYHAVTDIWLEDPVRFGDAESCAGYAETALKNLRFVYRDPDAKVSLKNAWYSIWHSLQSARSAFCSNLVAKVYATHIWRLQLKLQELEEPLMHFGALALATAAVTTLLF
jgi:hypothetical protein